MNYIYLTTFGKKRVEKDPSDGEIIINGNHTNYRQGDDGCFYTTGSFFSPTGQEHPDTPKTLEEFVNKY